MFSANGIKSFASRLDRRAKKNSLRSRKTRRARRRSVVEALEARMLLAADPASWVLPTGQESANGSLDVTDEGAIYRAFNTHDADRDAYAALKRELAVQHRTDRHGYTDAKTEFIRAIEAHALA